MNPARWRKALRVAAILLVPVQIADAFFLEVPVTAIVFAVVLTLGAYWLRRPGRAPVIAIGLVCLLQLLAVIIFFGIARPVPSPPRSEMALGALLGILSAAGLVATVGVIRPGAPTERRSSEPA